MIRSAKVHLVAGMVLALGISAIPPTSGALEDLRRLALLVVLEREVENVETSELTRRLATYLGGLVPAVAVDPTSPDRLRLTVAVRPYSSSALRGFPLPFSGTYAIGTVRLSLERSVHIVGGRPRITSAIVWQRERHIATRWSATGAAIGIAVGELLEALRDGRPAAPGGP